MNHMKMLRRIMVCFIILCGIGALSIIYHASPLSRWVAVKSLERQVKKQVDPAELQRWAMNVLSSHRYAGDSYGTNLPSILNLFEDRTPEVRLPSGGGLEAAVSISWGGKGGPFLLVGAPTFVTPNTRAILWKPGIYFL